MSDQDQSQSSGQEQRRENVRPQGERRDRHGARGRRFQQKESRRPEPALNMEELRELVELITEHGLTDFEFEREDFRIRLRRELGPTATAPTAPVAAAASTHTTQTSSPTASSPAPATPQVSPSAGTESPRGTAAAAAPSGTATTEAPRTPEDQGEALHTITSPIVGTFYRAPSPTAETFVRVGSHVEPNTIVCIIEAMKLMNEILAETTGVIEKIYVENGQPVEYGQPLFDVKKH
jgi:acetyl-CoA carboxylase biotin carboxyl carrier protein